METEKVVWSIESGMSANAQIVVTHLSVWDTFKDIWEINKAAFIGRYEKLKPTVSSFEADIARCLIKFCTHFVSCL